MTRVLSRVKHDEVVRMVKAVQRCGLPIGEVVYENGKVRVVIGGDSGEKEQGRVDETDDRNGPLREPQL